MRVLSSWHIAGVAIGKSSEPPPHLKLEQPFSLKAALKFGVIFLVLSVAGVLAQRSLGVFGFYASSCGRIALQRIGGRSGWDRGGTPSSIVACRSKWSGVSHTDKRVYQYSNRRSGRWTTWLTKALARSLLIVIAFGVFGLLVHKPLETAFRSVLRIRNTSATNTH